MKLVVMKKRGKKKKAIIICSIILAFAIVLNFGAFCFDVCVNGTGITKISVRARGLNKVVLKVNYVLAYGGYFAQNVPEDEGEYVGDGMIDYDGSLGKYRIMISFGDVEPSVALNSRLLKGDTIKTSPAKLKAKIAHPSDHGFVLYIGSDTPISVEDEYSSKFDGLNSIRGSIRIPITIKNLDFPSVVW